jgi:2-C-methyl-D-erythritol 4-phosphate cytidylyltransferase
MIVLVNAEDEGMVRRRLLPRLRRYRVKDLVVGGRTRQESVQNGLAHVPADADLVLIHDAVRPLVRKEMIEATIRAAQRVGAAILAAPVKATLKRTGANGLIRATVPRDNLWAAQTPQVFERRLILEAYATAAADRFHATDDAALVERLGHPVAIVEGAEENIKITTREDLRIAKILLAAQRKRQ